MSWGRLDDKFHSHRKVVDLGNFGAGLLTRLISWSCDHKTAGRVTRTVCVTFAHGDVTVAAKFGIVLPADYSDRLVDHLVSVGSLDPAGKGAYQIHDFDEYAKKAKDEKSAKEKAAERMRNHRKRKAERYANGDGNDARNVPVTFGVTPGDPDPVSSPLRSEEPVPKPGTQNPQSPHGGQAPAAPAGGSESGSSSSASAPPVDDADEPWPEPDPSQAAEPLPTKAGFVLKLFDPTEPPPPPANDPEVPMAFRDDHTLTLPGLEPQESPRRSDAPPSRASGPRRGRGQAGRTEVAGGQDEARKNDSRELIEETFEPPEETTETQRQADDKARYAKHFAVGVRSVTGDAGFALLSGQHHDLADICLRRGKGPDGKRLIGGKLDAWLEENGAAFARETAGNRTFNPLNPRSFERWLGEKAEAKAGGQPQRIGAGRATQTVDPKTGYVRLTDHRGLPAQGYDPSEPWARAVLSIPSVHDADPPDAGDEAPEARRAAG